MFNSQHVVLNSHLVLNVPADDVVVRLAPEMNSKTKVNLRVFKF